MTYSNLKRLVTNSIRTYKQRRELEKKGYREREKQKAKEKLGLWREEAKRNSEKNLERDFTVGNHQFRKTRGMGGVSIHHKGCMIIWVVKGFVFHCFS